MFTKIPVFLSILSFLLTSYVQANDTLATVSSHEIRFEKSKEIAVLKEVLQIGIDKINVKYEFLNESPQEINSEVAFPLPPIQENSLNWDENYIANKFLEENPSNRNLQGYIESAPFLNFKRTLNGEPFAVKSKTIARLPNGKDVTSLLTKNHIPLSRLLLTGFQEEGWLNKHAYLKKRLQQLKLLDSKELPLWTNQTIYFWDQTFPPQKTIISEHTYRPATGHFFISKKADKLSDLNSLELGGSEKKWADYCPSQKFTDELISLFKSDHPEATSVRRAYEVSYILTTGANWKGPIRDFNLHITPPPNTLVSFCWPDGELQKKEDGATHVSLKNFTPKQDLKILFIKKKREE